MAEERSRDEIRRRAAMLSLLVHGAVLAGFWTRGLPPASPLRPAAAGLAAVVFVEPSGPAGLPPAQQTSAQQSTVRAERPAASKPAPAPPPHHRQQAAVPVRHTISTVPIRVPAAHSAVVRPPMAADKEANTAPAGEAADGATSAHAGKGASPPATSQSTMAEGGVSNAAAPAPGAAAESAMASYLALLQKRIQDSLVYPPVARRLGLSGVVHLVFSVQADGEIDADSLLAADGNTVLRDGALETIRRLGVLPPPPRGAMKIQVPVVFTLIGH